MSPATIRKILLIVDHRVHDKVAAGQSGDGRAFFVDRIAFETAATRMGMLDKRRTMPNFHGVQPRDAGTNQFSSAGKAGHEVRLDQAGGDFQIGRYVTRVDPRGHAVRRNAKERVLRTFLTEMIFDAVVFENRGADHLPQLMAIIRTVQTGSHQQQGSCRGIPPFSSASNIGGSSTWLGTGRVTSQISTQALRRLPANSISGKALWGWANAPRTDNFGSANGSADR